MKPFNTILLAILLCTSLVSPKPIVQTAIRTESLDDAANLQDPQQAPELALTPDDEHMFVDPVEFDPEILCAICTDPLGSNMTALEYCKNSCGKYIHISILRFT